MPHQNYIFYATAALSCVMSLQAFNFVVVNNSLEDEIVKIKLKGSDEEPEHLVGMLKAEGGIGEKKFDGTQAEQCIDYIKVGDLKPEIFEVSEDQHYSIMSRRANSRDVTAYFQDNREKLRPISPQVGACHTRRFDIVGNVNNQLIIITKVIP